MEITSNLLSGVFGDDSSSSTIDLSSGLDGVFGQAMQDALGNVSSAVSVSDDTGTVNVLGEGLAGGLLTSFYQSKVNSTLSAAYTQLGGAGTTTDSTSATGIPTNSTGAVSDADSESDSSDSVSNLTAFASGDDFSYRDVLDVVNPLQHIPLVNYYYRDLTGDSIGYVPQVIGSTVYGGTLGAVGALAEVGSTQLLGESPTTYLLNAMTGNSDDSSSS